jgi:hypothetical protein
MAGFEDGRKYPGQNRTPLMFLRLEEIAAGLRQDPLSSNATNQESIGKNLKIYGLDV